MSDPTTQDYLTAIQEAKDGGHAVSLDFDNLPDGVDQTQVVKAMSNGLPDEYHQALTEASDGGHKVNLDFSAIQPPPDSMANHPYLDAAEKTAEFAAMIPGGTAGAAAGALTSPVTGPVGPLAGGAAGAGLAYGAVKSGADALNQTLGFTPSKSLSEGMTSAASDVKDGAAMETMGMGAGAAVGAGIKGAKAAFPYAAKVLKTLPKPVADLLMENPHLAEKYSGTAGAIDDAVGAVQDSLKTLKDQASKIYEDGLDSIGLGNPKTPGDAALKAANPKTLRVLPPKDIGTAYLELVTNPNLSDADKLAQAVKINKSINATTKWAGSGQNVKPVADDLAPTLQKIKDGVVKLLKTLPGGDKVINIDETWHAMRQVYDTLQPNLADTGKATAWLTKVISDEGTASATSKAALQTLQEAAGKPVVDDAVGHIAVGLAKRPMADSMMGKMGMILAFAHPGSRMLTLPLIAGAQSPVMQTTAMRGLNAAGEALAANPTAMGPMIAALHQGAKDLPKQNSSGKPSQRDD